MSEKPPPLVVIKAGGSLLARPGGLGLLRNWLASSESLSLAQSRVLLVGGGPVVEGLRTVDAANPLPDAATHWAAIEMLDALAKMLEEELPGFELTDQLAAIRKAPPGEYDWLLAPGRFLWEEEPLFPGPKLASGWEVTCDSIALRLAQCWGAPLMLLKSAWSDQLQPGDWSHAAEMGYVDSFFPQCARAETEVEVRVL